MLEWIRDKNIKPNKGDLVVVYGKIQGGTFDYHLLRYGEMGDKITWTMPGIDVPIFESNICVMRWALISPASDLYKYVYNHTSNSLLKKKIPEAYVDLFGVRDQIIVESLATSHGDDFARQTFIDYFEKNKEHLLEKYSENYLNTMIDNIKINSVVDVGERRM